MTGYANPEKGSTPAAPPRWRAERATGEADIEILNRRRVHQPKGPHHLRADVRLGSVLVFNVLASERGVAWPMRHGDPLVVILDDELRRRVEQALRSAAWQVNVQTEVPA